MSLVHDSARMIGMGLGAGQTAPNTVCPVCGGGRSKEASFSVSRMPDGRIAFNCYRDSCTVTGGYVDDNGYTPAVPAKVQTRKLKPYLGEVYPPRQTDYNYFYMRFGLNAQTVERNIKVGEDNDYVFPIRSRLGKVVGYVQRQPVWTGSPAAPRSGKGYGPKAKTWMHEDAEPLAFYPAQDPKWGRRPTVIVEDSVSAMRVAQLVDVRAVALLGTTLNMHRVREIARFSNGNVVLALDEDATGTAFKLAQQWSLAFKTFRVALLDTDLKDMGDDNADMLHVLGIT